MSSSEVARLLGVSQTYVNRLALSGTLPPADGVLNSGQRVWLRQTIEHYLTATRLEKPVFGSDSHLKLGSTLEAIRRNGYLRVAVMDGQPGLSSRSSTGELEGFEIDLALKLAQSLFGGSAQQVRQNVKFIETPLPDRCRVIESDEADLVVANFADTPERRKQVHFSGHYIFTPNAPITTTDAPAVDDADALNGLTVAITPDSVQGELLPRIAPNAELVEFPGLPECLDALQRGSVQVFMSDVVSNKGYKMRLNSELKTPALRCSGERWGVGMRKGADDLSALIEKTVREEMESGALSESLRRWVS